ncbi:hypothetical protein ACH5RR_039210 [Cinchona calisaya]|uniref:Uncharacterized protein n=1 Tax=Cinchona calisaya TaxID=153742 RepID=A0ABD2Y2R4_9GENT
MIQKKKKIVRRENGEEEEETENGNEGKQLDTDGIMRQRRQGYSRRRGRRKLEEKLGEDGKQKEGENMRKGRKEKGESANFLLGALGEFKSFVQKVKKRGGVGEEWGRACGDLERVVMVVVVGKSKWGVEGGTASLHPKKSSQPTVSKKMTRTPPGGVQPTLGRRTTY